MKIKRLQFYRLMYTQDGIFGNMVIEVPITREKFLKFIYDAEFSEAVEFGRLVIENYDLLNLSRAQDWMDNEEIRNLEIVIYFNLGTGNYKKVTENVLIKKLFHGRKTILSTVNHFNYHKVIIYEKESDIDFSKEFLFSAYERRTSHVTYRNFIWDYIKLFNVLETLTNDNV